MHAKKNVYEIVTDSVLGLLDRGTVPWRAGHHATAAGPGRNGHTGHRYSGINAIMTWAIAQERGYESDQWYTFAQLKKMGASVLKGSKAIPVIYWSIREDEAGKTSSAFCRYYSAFNREQTTLGPAELSTTTFDHDPIGEAESIVAGFQAPTGPTIQFGGSQPCYQPTSDVVRMVPIDRYESAEGYYATLFHELAHATGHPTRLNRDLVPYSMGRESYAAEELTAEMAAAFICHAAGIGQPVIENQAAYIDSWRRAISADPKIVVQAASRAQKAADLIMSRSAVASVVAVA